ncbi:MAG: carbon-nitrogen hydrolase family protein [Candidatus Hydrogenedentes bacterium]|nr:carbon-nitrogen hydrolase family protein [Candidatus Hydrogenedentota bacterium]
MPTVRVSGVQMYVSPKLDENLPKILEHIRNTDADFLLFPEMSLTGYHVDFSDKAVKQAWRQIATACRQSYVTALIGTGCKTEGETYIQTRVYGHTGELVGTHEKLVPTTNDRKFCMPGEVLRVFHLNGVAFGCLICNDLWVTPGCGPYPDPRLAYQLGQRGARIIFHSIHSGTSAIHIPYHESNLALRAIESSVFIVTANAADKRGSINASTGVMSPKGGWLVQCPREGEQTFTYDIELET